MWMIGSMVPSSVGLTVSVSFADRRGFGTGGLVTFTGDVEAVLSSFADVNESTEEASSSCSIDGLTYKSL